MSFSLLLFDDGEANRRAAAAAELAALEPRRPRSVRPMSLLAEDRAESRADAALVVLAFDRLRHEHARLRPAVIREARPGARYRVRVPGDLGRRPRPEGERTWAPPLSGKRLALAIEADRIAYPEAATLPSLPTRAECVDGPRPCAHVRCRHHMGVDIRTWKDGSFRGIKEMRDWADDGHPTCALDAAEAAPVSHYSDRTVGGEHRGWSQAAIGAMLGLTRAGVCTIEAEAKRKLREGLLDAGIDGELVESVVASLAPRNAADGPRPLDARDDGWAGSVSHLDDGGASTPRQDEPIYAGPAPAAGVAAKPVTKSARLQMLERRARMRLHRHPRAPAAKRERATEVTAIEAFLKAREHQS